MLGSPCCGTRLLAVGHYWLPTTLQDEKQTWCVHVLGRPLVPGRDRPLVRSIVPRCQLYLEKRASLVTGFTLTLLRMTCTSAQKTSKHRLNLRGGKVWQQRGELQPQPG